MKLDLTITMSTNLTKELTIVILITTHHINNFYTVRIRVSCIICTSVSSVKKPSLYHNWLHTSFVSSVSSVKKPSLYHNGLHTSFVTSVSSVKRPSLYHNGLQTEYRISHEIENHGANSFELFQSLLRDFNRLF